MIRGMSRAWRVVLASGRTVPYATLTAPGEVEALVEEHGIHRDVEGAWNHLSTTQRLDCIASTILAKDRAKRVAEYRAKRRRLRNETEPAEVERYKRGLAAVRGNFLLRYQLEARRQREVFFPHLDFLDRTFRWTDWHWDDGGWYGDAPTIITEVLPALYDAMPRSPENFWVGVWWSPPRGTA